MGLPSQEDHKIAHAKGEQSEHRFLSAVQIRHPETPHWLVCIEKADIDLDLRGVDAIAHVLYRGEEWAERIPIQVKSSWGGKRHHIAKHAEHGAQRVLYMIIHDHLNERDIQKILYAELGKIRAQGMKYNNFFAALLADRLSPGAERVRIRVLRSRMRIEHAPREHSPIAHTVAEEAPVKAKRNRFLRWLFPSRNDATWKP